jgi:hypothetical protein
MNGATWTRLGRHVPLLAAAALFSGLALANLRTAPPVYWVVTTPIAAGMPVTLRDGHWTSQIASSAPAPGEVARVPLVPGQLLTPGTVGRGGSRLGALATLPVDAATAAMLTAGDHIRFVAWDGRREWVSPAVTVVSVAANGMGSSAITVGASFRTLLAILPHAGSAWVVVDGTEGRP